MALQQKQQLTFDWGRAKLPAPASDIPASASLPPAVPELLVPPGTERVYEWLDELIPPDCRTVQLPWDFETTFPEPLDEAARVGALDAESLSQDGVASLHHEHARECLAVLSDLEALRRAFGAGTDPRTGNVPRTPSGREGLEKTFAEQPHALKHAFDVLLEVYENAFGDGAADAFRLYLVAQSRGIPVAVERVMEDQPAAAEAQHQDQDVMPYRTTSDAETSPTDGPPEPELPVPRPLQCAVRRGAFGTDENDDPVDPSEEEVQAITEHFAERLTALQGAVANAENRLRHSTGPERESAVRGLDTARSAYLSALGLYEEDFGLQAARHLDSYVQHVARREEEPVTAYTPGHPWYYLKRGDGRQPVPIDEIPPAEPSTDVLSKKLPRNKDKRRAMIKRMLDDQRRQLDEDKLRYQELLERGVGALSDYDRNIAHGGDEELAWASSLSLKYNHISLGLGRLEELQRAE